MPNANFNFPYSRPYDIQLELMSTIYEAIESRKIAFLESPTGTVSKILACNW
jgi:chromosome transmission fidelity protein 1